ncbi:MAG: phenylalanine--tRNA ligase subunit alpha [Anaerolineae bacterium]
MSSLETMEREALAELESASDSAALEAWESKYLGRKGALTLFMRTIGSLPADERPKVGQAANKARQALEAGYNTKAEQVRQAEIVRTLGQEALDVTLPGRAPAAGRLHPSTVILRRIYDVFAQMGFEVFQSREVETDEYNFELLNIPRHHPARDMWDTFYVSDNVVLRTHTSPGQLHAMRQYCPEPIRVILPGRCYRYEQVSSRHEFMFHQVEGLAVGRGITLADLNGVMETFAQGVFGQGRRIRLRSGYFPFTEPSVEVDMDCGICGGAGCRLCKGSGWVEIAGAGMVHPVVLRNGGYDPEVYSGFAFGMGPERIAMGLFGIDDIRYFFGNDIRFLRQFGRLA